MFKFNKRKGITLITLIAIITVSIILTSTIVISYSSFKTSAKKKSFAMELYTLELQIKEYKMHNNTYPINQKKEFDINVLDSKLLTIMEQLGEEISQGKVELYTIDFNKININSLVRGVEKDGELDVYVYSTKTHNLYYLKGEEIENNIYYYFDDELYNILKIK